MDLYVYYRVRIADAAQLQPQVRAMQRELAQGFGVQCALKRRVDTKDEQQTWMEIYRDVPEGFLAALTEAADASPALALIDGERHVETFVDLAPCA